MATAQANLDVTQYVRVNLGQYPITLQAQRDSVRVIFSDDKPARGSPVFHLIDGGDEPWTVEYNDTNVWALATSANSSLFVTEFVDGFLRIRDPRNAATLDGSLFTITGTYTVSNGETLAFNLFPAADLIIHRVSVNADLPVTAYSMHATGSPDGIFTAAALNLILGNTSPSQGQMYYNAVSQGTILCLGQQTIEPRIVASVGDTPSFSVTNDTGASKALTIVILIEEIGAQADPFGLLPTTNLMDDTEMSVYG